MAEFESKVYEIKVREHPHADRLDIAMVGDYRCVIGKDSLQTGDLAAYIPEGAIVPDDILEEMGLVGRLAGSKRNRVKAVKLRKVLSQGLVYPTTGKRLATRETYPGKVVTDALGLIKYEPPIPSHMNGVVKPAHGYTLKYDIENIKKFPDVFEDGETVVVTEKLHGTWACFGWHPDVGYIVTSKGLSAKGLRFDLKNPKNDTNLYVQKFRTIEKHLHPLMQNITPEPTAIYVLGEIFGKGVQDLYYGSTRPVLRVFDIYIGAPGHGYYLGAYDVMKSLVGFAESGLIYAPVLYAGPYERETVDEVTNGMTVLGGGNIREGVVVRPADERRNDDLGRVILKSVSEQYLLRKGGSELN